MPNIVVIGASAGGIETLRQILAGLPEDLEAAMFVAMHLSPMVPSILPKILSHAGPLPASTAVDGEQIGRSQIYVAPPDFHMLIEAGVIRLTRGPHENRHRPAIDPLFRSAARAYGSRVLGIVLTGMSDDGSLGLQVIKQEGGYAIVQDPIDAMFPTMPSSAIEAADVDYILPAAEIAPKIIELVVEPWERIDRERAPEIRQERRTAEGEKMSEDLDERVVGKPSQFTCPDCNGTLWEVDEGGLLRFRCRIGHAFSPESMRDGYGESVEGALWSAVRSLEESAALERRLASDAAAGGNKGTAARFQEIAADREEQAEVIRALLMSKSRHRKEPQ